MGILVLMAIAIAVYYVIDYITKFKQEVYQTLENLSDEQDELEGLFIEEAEEIKDSIKSVKSDIDILSSDNATTVVVNIPQIKTKMSEIEERLNAVELIVGKRVKAVNQVDTSLLP